ncbi:MAG: superoxide dismutase [FCB group bacterium]|nr:superoxide dismutase [FCB group bacterium]
MAYTLPSLPYAYNALEPYIDKETMTIHHTKHHQAYLNKLNAILEMHADLQTKPAEELLMDLNSIPENIRTAVRNHGGGFVNHSFFWQILKKDVVFKGEIAEAIKAKFGSFDHFKEQFINTAGGQFGSGWGWLAVNNGELEIISTPNQDSPLSAGKKPILSVDVWEHAYYLKYQNRRPEYLEAFFNVINWEKVNELFLQAK